MCLVVAPFVNALDYEIESTFEFSDLPILDQLIKYSKPK